jgi:hypothetical protein
MSTDRPDTQQLMKQIDEAARKIEQQPVSAERPFVPTRAPMHVASNPSLEENWDAWVPPHVTTHRGLLGLPIVWLKRFLTTASCFGGSATTTRPRWTRSTGCAGRSPSSPPRSPT